MSGPPTHGRPAATPRPGWGAASRLQALTLPRKDAPVSDEAVPARCQLLHNLAPQLTSTRTPNPRPGWGAASRLQALTLPRKDAPVSDEAVPVLCQSLRRGRGRVPFFPTAAALPEAVRDAAPGEGAVR
jgi:hypothetical protein